MPPPTPPPPPPLLLSSNFADDIGGDDDVAAAKEEDEEVSGRTYSSTASFDRRRMRMGAVARGGGREGDVDAMVLFSIARKSRAQILPPLVFCGREERGGGPSRAEVGERCPLLITYSFVGVAIEESHAKVLGAWVGGEERVSVDLPSRTAS